MLFYFPRFSAVTSPCLPGHLLSTQEERGSHTAARGHLPGEPPSPGTQRPGDLSLSSPRPGYNQERQTSGVPINFRSAAPSARRPGPGTHANRPQPPARAFPPSGSLHPTSASPHHAHRPAAATPPPAHLLPSALPAAKPRVTPKPSGRSQGRSSPSANHSGFTRPSHSRSSRAAQPRSPAPGMPAQPQCPRLPALKAVGASVGTQPLGVEGREIRSSKPTSTTWQVWDQPVPQGDLATKEKRRKEGEGDDLLCEPDLLKWEMETGGPASM
ncbi:vegetative cell wall protein gp1-like [Mastomys coucha]|uniref:vegetative cell wall protein gp1-like n=1 Tax=Mastomys coucha TaxID=35658 RepID=UPI001262A457|nr:vegetative cell wall protein gp1-like [Mastomys coucha]